MYNSYGDLVVTYYCTVCYSFRKRALRFGDQVRYAADFDGGALLLSASRCFFCAIVLESIQKSGASKDEALDRSVARIYIRGPAETPPRTLSFEIYFKDSRAKLELETYAQDSSGSKATNDVVSHTVNHFRPTHPQSSESLSWVQSRLDNCLETHTKCLDSTETELPSRLLSLKKAADGSITVSLWETNHTIGAYACLSHRWGGSESGRTTSSSYADMLKGIPWESIPRTFQEVMQLATSLGIENIWIDSFCIIQDDIHDWQEQAAQMGKIYQNSYLTLAATASPNNESGCFWDSNTSYEKQFAVERGPFVVRGVVRKTMKHWDMLWTSAVAFPLLSRAWVFQERLLSPRVLHFSHHELVWECRELGECQCGGYHAPSNPKARDWTSDDSWASAVELFTSLQLTVDQDRLPAFFGFASFFAQSIGASIETDYFAGLWRQSLYADLLWKIDSSAHKLGVGVNRLCCCFDSTYSSDVNWRCQYSYSAACSLACLDQRRLCRYGKEDAAVCFNMDIKGSCSEENKVTSLTQLRQLCTTYLMQDGEGLCLEPSWSWVSARTRVQYLKGIGKSRSKTDCKIDTNLANYSPWHEHQPITSTMIIVSGYVTRALLHYESIPDPAYRSNTIRHHNIYSYGLEIMKDQSHLDFDPDYILSLEGERWIPPATPVFILHIASGAHLVLKEKSFFELSRQERIRLTFTLGGTRSNSMNPDNKYVRIGIFAIPENTGIRTHWEHKIMIV